MSAALDCSWAGHLPVLPISTNPASSFSGQDGPRCKRQRVIPYTGGKVARTTQLHNATWTAPSVALEVGCSIRQGGRPYQEDTFDTLSTSALSMVAVYDGHGGATTSTALRSLLLPALRDALEPVLMAGGASGHVRVAMVAAIRETFLQVNTTLSTGDAPVSDGSTAAVLVMCEVQGRLLAFSANAGDSRITLGATTQAHPSRRSSAPNAGPSSPDSDVDSASSSAASSSDGEETDSHGGAEGGVWRENRSCPLPGSLPGSGSLPGGVVRAPLAGSPSFAVRLSQDHDLDNNPEEQERIRLAGGVLGRFERGGPLRVHSHAGGLNMGRAFGDVAYAGSVIADPYISVTTIADPAEFIVVASDGLWGVMQDAEVAAYVHTLFQFNDVATRGASSNGGSSGPDGKPSSNAADVATVGSPRAATGAARGFSTQQVAELVQHEAAKRWSARCPGKQDNTTVAIVRLGWP